MRTLTLATPAEATALVDAVRRAMDRGLAVWGVTYTPGGTKVVVHGFAPVVNDVLRAAGAR